jgi:hypothetical protein
MTHTTDTRILTIHALNDVVNAALSKLGSDISVPWYTTVSGIYNLRRVLDIAKAMTHELHGHDQLPLLKSTLAQTELGINRLERRGRLLNGEHDA